MATPILSWIPMTLLAIAPSTATFIIAYTLVGFSLGFHLPPLYLTCVEIFIDLPQWRARAGALLWVVWSVVVASESLVAYIIDSIVRRAVNDDDGLAAPFSAWRVLILSLLCLQLPIPLLLWFFMPESPAWLKSKGKIDAYEAVMRSLQGKIVKDKAIERDSAGLLNPVAQINESSSSREGKIVMDDSGADAACRQRNNNLSTSMSSRQLGLLSWKEKYLGRRIITLTLASILSWFAVSIAYYGLYLNAKSFSNDIYVGSAISSLEQIPAYYFTADIINTIGRRRTQCVCFTIGGIAMLLLSIITSDTAKNVLAFLSLLVISVSFGTVYTYTAELYPVTLRGDALGIGIVSSRAGSVLAPQIQILLGALSEAAPQAIFGILSLLAAGANAILPETLKTGIDSEEL